MQAHGVYHCKIEDRILICTLTGAWNIEEAILYKNHVFSIITALTDKPWYCIIEATGFEGSTPEAYHMNSEMIKELKEMNLQKRGIVCKSTAILDISRTFQPHFEDVETRFFDHLDSAKQWLSQQ